jgi:hypothetical protein
MPLKTKCPLVKTWCRLQWQCAYTTQKFLWRGDWTFYNWAGWLWVLWKFTFYFFWICQTEISRFYDCLNDHSRLTVNLPQNQPSSQSNTNKRAGKMIHRTAHKDGSQLLWLLSFWLCFSSVLVRASFFIFLLFFILMMSPYLTPINQMKSAR